MDRKRKLGYESSNSGRNKQTRYRDDDARNIILNKESKNTDRTQGNNIWSNRQTKNTWPQNHDLRRHIDSQRGERFTTVHSSRATPGPSEYPRNRERMGDPTREPIEEDRLRTPSRYSNRHFNEPRKYTTTWTNSKYKTYNRSDSTVNGPRSPNQAGSQNRTHGNLSRKRMNRDQYQSNNPQKRSKWKEILTARQRNGNESRRSSLYKCITVERFTKFNDRSDLNDEDFEDFKSLFCSMTSFNKDEIRGLMTVLRNLFQEQNAALCETLMENDFFDRDELKDYVSDILLRPRQMNNLDIEFVQNSTQVLVAMSLEPKTEASKVIDFLNLIILVTKEQDRGTVLANLPRLFLQEVKERLKSDSNKKPFSDYSKEELFTMINFDILPSSVMVRNKIAPKLKPRQLERAPATEAQYIVEQFSLFLEDFIGPLREGIQNYLDYASCGDGSIKGRFRDENIRLYEGVRILERKCVPNAGIVVEVKFDTEGLRGVQWETSDYLKYNNVVCLTYGDCDTLLYALIADRNPKHLNEGKISLSLVAESFQPCELLMKANGRIVMLESKAFYTAYRHTLEAMKSIARKMYIDSQYAGIPFSEHIVELKTNVSEPLYSKWGNDEEMLANFNCMLQNSADGKDYSKVPLAKLDSWPSKMELGMNEQQYCALQLCLTKKLGILQGPPGTGKTWMGLRILEFLLNNDLGFHNSEKRPILLLSYTNHALDQIFDALFDMDSLSKIFSAGGNPFVRVGSRSIVPRIQQCTLAEHRKQQKSGKSKKYFENVMKLKQKIFEIELWLEKMKNSIVSSSFLYEKECIIDKHKHSLNSDPNTKTDEVICHWLEIGTSNRNIQFATMQVDVRRVSDDDKEILRDRSLARIVEDVDDFAFNERISFSKVISKLIVSEELLLPKDEKNVSHSWNRFTRDEREKILNHISLKLRLDTAMSEEEEQNVANVWRLSIDEKWRLYKAWIRKIQVLYEQEKKTLMEKFEKENNIYMNEKQKENTRIVSKCSLVGMTTTGAAQNIDLLRKVQPRIVVVEEAAQVFEQHIIGCLTEGLQHLILIGDHQQLRPPINNYKLSKKYKTDVSMMERLVMNGMPYVCLSQQHRMRPEISSLLTPTIYKDLQNHQSVLSCEHIRGFQHDVYFLDHTYPESQTRFSTSHKNEFEAEMISKIFQYLLIQGYNKQDITILSPYNDQVKLIRNYLRKIDVSSNVSDHEKALITAVDNFQGEENEIILLSLVRGNDERKIGHLHDIKRICVSLSRAKRGFFVLGNFQTIRKSETWNEIISKAESNGIFGTYLPLRCVNHPGTIRKVSKPSDFDLVPSGGCTEPCGFQRSCGHICNLKCHPTQSLHETPCMKVCEKTLCDNGHKCKRECSHPLPCGPCEVQMTKVFKKCKHDIKVNCSTDLDTVECQQPCSKQYSCGHSCTQPCGVSCRPEQCSVLLPQVHPRCSHEIMAACCKRTKLYETKCFKECSAILSCGHVCKGDCFSCSSGRLHILCNEVCKRVLVCGHSCNSKHSCSTDCPPCSERCPSGCEHLAKRGCPKKCGEKCIDCREPCLWVCDKGCKNGYRCSKQCFEECTRPRCEERCKKNCHVNIAASDYVESHVLHCAKSVIKKN
ncbi:NFX1-type zinc finger-containing protein 1-like isoform X1 [Crassostrea virginica]